MTTEVHTSLLSRSDQADMEGVFKPVMTKAVVLTVNSADLPEGADRQMLGTTAAAALMVQLALKQGQDLLMAQGVDPLAAAERVLGTIGTALGVALGDLDVISQILLVAALHSGIHDGVLHTHKTGGRHSDPDRVPAGATVN